MLPTSHFSSKVLLFLLLLLASCQSKPPYVEQIEYELDVQPLQHWGFAGTGLLLNLVETSEGNKLLALRHHTLDSLYIHLDKEKEQNLSSEKADYLFDPRSYQIAEAADLKALFFLYNYARFKRGSAIFGDSAFPWSSDFLKHSVQLISSEEALEFPNVSILYGPRDPRPTPESPHPYEQGPIGELHSLHKPPKTYYYSTKTGHILSDKKEEAKQIAQDSSSLTDSRYFLKTLGSPFDENGLGLYYESTKLRADSSQYIYCRYPQILMNFPIDTRFLDFAHANAKAHFVVYSPNTSLAIKVEQDSFEYLSLNRSRYAYPTRELRYLKKCASSLCNPRINPSYWLCEYSDSCLCFSIAGSKEQFCTAPCAEQNKLEPQALISLNEKILLLCREKADTAQHILYQIERNESFVELYRFRSSASSWIATKNAGDNWKLLNLSTPDYSPTRFLALFSSSQGEECLLWEYKTRLGNKHIRFRVR